MQTTQSPKAGERTQQRIQNPTPQVAAIYAEEDGRFNDAAILYCKAGDIAGGHNHAANMYAKANECRREIPKDANADDAPITGEWAE